MAGSSEQAAGAREPLLGAKFEAAPPAGPRPSTAESLRPITPAMADGPSGSSLSLEEQLVQAVNKVGARAGLGM